jgi:hypothetical protein
MYLSIRDHDVQLLQDCADSAIKALQGLGFDETQSLVDQLAQYLKSQSVRIQYWELGPNILALHLYEPHTGHFIAINENLKKIPDAAARRMATKKLFCHEFSHIVLNHPPSYSPPQTTDPTVCNLFSALMQFASNPAVHGKIENDAEVFSAALGFWPQIDFVKSFIEKRAEFRLIANQFKMPIDCAIKWALLSLGGQFPMHYLKYNVTTKQVEDYYIPDNYALFPWEFNKGTVFSDQKTTAFKCLSAIDDREGKITVEERGREVSYVCHAFYRKQNKDQMLNDDKILVGGWSDKIFGLIESLAKSAASLANPPSPKPSE